MPMKTAKDADTRARLFAATEMLLLERGDDVSIRSICAAADANVAAVHYHFGSREALLTALLEDRLAPVWRQPLTGLAETDAPVSAYVDAIVEPFSALAADPIGRCHLRLLGKIALDRDNIEWSSHWFQLHSWVAVLCANQPDLDAKEAGRRWMFAFELVLLHFGTDRVPSAASTNSLRTFVIAGLTAPVQP
ncbi:TetR/AcrR family transcriptional regulator [Antrihabitans sp. YC2-6]|uniref:TetR/AcrR family transcriptional regulator n=1 Tax=Antrihabitans sp. YC2-6 TaxID=2799498 RepID=UPI0018F65E3C|nr:TetR/AcrR family transcriptional regulator [Antrihabitans sp. YC2-6]MBJ8347481.1 TetR/AcrR family transcriptional regulator [Antrihabitans sp. YC2-6]